VSKSKFDWDGLRAQAEDYLAEQSAAIGKFAAKAAPLFEAMWTKVEGSQSRRRRPNISLRLIMAGQPLAKLVTLPYWRASSHSQTILTDRLYLEMLVEEAAADAEPGKKWTRQCAASIEAGGILKPTLIRKAILTDLQRVVATLEDFVASPTAVLARSHDWCCCCGRTLTDEVSRARGIGPECIKLCELVVWLTERSLVCLEES